ncbi:hypothetical protein BS47DRAFT_1307524 [Hydnum rufescens UP504]|uniref:Retrotransposon gag domain-containing protein n=1 Tax=Hydnum rufescens UP504 TaxID=1448309 RepID=A0A9P6DHN0_9AGAM|nr:hypothetical protein BS47DRAFT_1307524 [Hydnum rufescens UP504]
MGGPQGHITSRSLPASLFKIKYDIKPADLPTWDGQDDTFLQWAEDLNVLAATGPEIAKQLGEVMPTRFADQAQHWWHTLPLHECAKAMQSWLSLRSYIMQNMLATQWMELQWLEFQKIGYRQAGFPDETPTSFLWRKVQARRVLVPARSNDPNYDSQEVMAIMDKTPHIWSSLLQLENAPNVGVVSQQMQDLEDQLIAHMDMDQLNPEMIVQ